MEVIQIDRSELMDFLQNRDIISIAERHWTKKLEPVDNTMNLFTIISNIYHQENFHSDILKIFLDTNGAHNEGGMYLNSFLTFVKSSGAAINKSLGNAINISDYKNAKVIREKGKIDLLIRSDKKAIIIENKINGAVDMNRQLPRYLEYVKNENLQCDAIIYLTLNQNKKPDQTDWSDAEKKEIEGEIIPIVAYNETKNDLLNGWINKGILSSTHIDALLILRQYGKLIKKLGGDIMDTQLMEEFYNILSEKDFNNYNTACSIKELLENLGNYLAKKIVSDYENGRYPKPPFSEPFVCAGNQAVFDEWLSQEHKFCLMVTCTYDNYEVRFFDHNEKDESIDFNLKKILDENELIKGDNDSGFYRNFTFPKDEKDLYTFLRNFMSDLSIKKDFR